MVLTDETDGTERWEKKASSCREVASEGCCNSSRQCSKKGEGGEKEKKRERERVRDTERESERERERERERKHRT